MDSENIIQKIKSYESDYKSFMKITTLPEYSIITKTASLNVAETKGFESLASSKYDLKKHIHSLLVSCNVPLCRYVVFHEFTHMIDTEIYAKNDTLRYIGISGYTEYHASQIELLDLLSVENINEIISFSINNTIETVSGKKTVTQYLSEKYNHAVELFSRKDFPSDIDTLKSALGVLFNYWGLRSICKMYSSDFMLQDDNQIFLKYISHMDFKVLNNLMIGFMNDTNIELCIMIYNKIIFSLINKYDLK